MDGMKVLLAIGVAGLALLSGCGGCGKEAPPAAPTPVPTAPPTVAAAAAKPAVPPGEKSAASKPVDTDNLLIWADVDPDEGPAPLKVKLDVDPIEEIDGARYTWDFGDGSPPSNEMKPEHVYEKPGTYTARVKVTDSAGMTGDDSTEIVVLGPDGAAPPAAAQAVDEGRTGLPTARPLRGVGGLCPKLKGKHHG